MVLAKLPSLDRESQEGLDNRLAGQTQPKYQLDGYCKARLLATIRLRYRCGSLATSLP